jgi:hypothetical protein
MKEEFMYRLLQLKAEQDILLERINVKADDLNGLYTRYKYPVLTAAHTPLDWRYDFDEKSNPYLMQRFGINAVLNAGAIRWKGRYLLMARVEGYDRKSFFAIAESPNGVDNFRFWEYPACMPETGTPDVNVYDVRLWNMKMVGCMDYSVQNEETLQRNRSVFGYRPMWHCPYKGYAPLGTFSGFADKIPPTTECGIAS